MCPIIVAEGSFPGTAITSILMADPIPTTFGQEIDTTQPTQEAPVVAVEAVVPAHVLAPVQAVAVPAVARKIHTKIHKSITLGGFPPRVLASY